MKRLLLTLIAVMAISILAACGSNNENESELEMGTSEQKQAEISKDELIDDDEVVVKVNKQEVFGNQYNFIYAQLKTQYEQMGEKTDLDELKETTINKIIEEELLAQEAEAKGVEVSDEEAQAQIDQLKDEAEDNLKTILEQFQITEDEFKARLRFEMTMEKYQDQHIDVDVTDADVEATYEDIKAENEEVPEFSEIKDQIKAQLYNEKINEQLGEIVDKAKDKADIKRVYKA